MIITKKSEKILIWMNRNYITGKCIADQIGITRQAVSNKLKQNSFTPADILVLKRLGFKE